ncbi:FprA family A-type flavoprotein [Candidatus Acidulodesulfobacterium sp. H_13]|uniref:FprA family A-type flavoprotein n=1 Tax=Candidatus Acidulodesulfobacterium sp. H_13 TaxID=3395470 RepID=UPI003AF65E03
MDGDIKKALPMKDGVSYVGALDPDLKAFDIIVPTKNGTTYNSYFIQGSHKSALIDTVKIGMKDQLIDKLNGLTDISKIDYIIINHTEPDHSGSLNVIREIAKNATLVYSKNAHHFVKHIVKGDYNNIIVGDGDSIDLGGKTLQFVGAPFLHWPDTMFTYLKEDKILFSCDFFGTHYCDVNVFNDLIEDKDAAFEAFKFYFACIMRPFKNYSMSALEKLKDYDINMIAPSHGPILRKDLKKYIDWYTEASKTVESNGAVKKIAVIYASAYGNTEKMAKHIAKGADIKGSTEIEMVNLVNADAASVIDTIERSDAVIIGSPTFNAKPPKPILDMISSMVMLNVKNKKAAVFGCYGWSGEAVKMVQDIFKSLKFVIVQEGLKIQITPFEEDLLKCEEFGRDFADKITQD